VRYSVVLLLLLAPSAVGLAQASAGAQSHRNSIQSAVTHEGSLFRRQSAESQDPQFGRERQKDPDEEKLEHTREKALNKQRQTQLTKDTDRLLKLATELKEYVDKTDEHMLSLDVVKKAEEIEKLAKSVKDKMKGSY